MYEAGLWIAAGIGFLSLLLGSRTAIPLLASFGLVAALCYSGVRFEPAVWLLIDFAVILCIVSNPKMNQADLIILCLFFPAWVAYWLPADMRAALLWGVIVGQFVLTFPLVKVCNCIGRTIDKIRRDGPGMEFSYG